MNWDIADYVVFIALVSGVGFLSWKVVQKTDNRAYRLASGIALAGAFMLLWVNAAVGIIGDANNDANMMYFGVLALGASGALIARFQARGLAWTLCAVALGQVLVGVIAIFADLGVSGPVWPSDVLMLSAVFTTLWLVSAWLFRKAAYA